MRYEHTDSQADVMMDDMSDFFLRHYHYCAQARRLASWDEVRLPTKARTPTDPQTPTAHPQQEHRPSYGLDFAL